MSENVNFMAFLPAFIRYNEALSYKERLIWAELSARLDEKGQTKVSNKALAKAFKLDTSSISKAVLSLEKLGLLSLEYNAGKERIIELLSFENVAQGVTSSLNTETKAQDFEKEALKEATQVLNEALPARLDKTLWAQWLAHHKQKTRKDYTKIALARLITRMKKLFEAGKDVNAMIKRAIESNWQGFIFDEPANKTAQNTQHEALMGELKSRGIYLSDVISAPNHRLKLENKSVEAVYQGGKWQLRQVR